MRKGENVSNIVENDKKTVVVGLIKGKHEIPTNNYIFDGDIENVHDYDKIYDHIFDWCIDNLDIDMEYSYSLDALFDEDKDFDFEAIPIYSGGNNNLIVYISGLTMVVVELIKVCYDYGIGLTLMNYNIETKEYVPQCVF